ncbi:hypothetical protein BT93_C2324 [Corymbia citriodora subsp. variegata]|nr:hypothetical protein BT93_C2324 [Corymbia citriodora subsp. variegata]
MSKGNNSSGLFLWILLQFLGSIASNSEDVMHPSDPVYTYARIAEIEQQCSSYLSSAVELNLDSNGALDLKKELSFSNGDWEQEPGGAPLMPFHNKDLPIYTPLKLVSFELEDVSPVRQLRNAVSVEGCLTIGIYIDLPWEFKSGFNSDFTERPGMSALVVEFKGVYLETEETGGQRVMCLLGNSTLPSWRGVNDDLLYLPNDYGSVSDGQPRVLPDDRILLLLRYPKTFNLTSRAINGEMTSLNDRESLRYFDRVFINSQLSDYSRYRFSEGILSEACDVNLCQDDWIKDGSIALSGAEFCKVIRANSDTGFVVKPNYKYDSAISPVHPRKFLGPSDLGNNIGDANQSYDDIELIFQTLYCENEIEEARSGVTKVSATLRAMPTQSNRYLAITMTGLSGRTLSAEGLWNSSSGKLCMVGCLRVDNSGLQDCDFRVSLYFPRYFSITQRSIITGSITATGDRNESLIPLHFSFTERPSLLVLLDWYCDCCRYNYSKFDLAKELWDRNQPLEIMSFIKQSIFTYPMLKDSGDLFAQLSILSEDLHFDAFAVPKPFNDDLRSLLYVQADVLSLGPLCSCPQYCNSTSKDKRADEAELFDSRFLNVSIHLTFSKPPLLFMEVSYKGVSRLFMEGLYDTLLGEMYLIGCREVMSGSTLTERGLDCLIESKIKYSSETARWLETPKIELTIASRRKGDDPLHFGPISLQTVLIASRPHEQEFAFRVGSEGALRILILAVEIAIILSQLRYMSKNAGVAAHISLAMLKIQAVGYCVPLISSTAILFKSNESKSYVNFRKGFARNEQLILVLEYFGKLLVLTALMLILKLAKNVIQSRKASPLHDDARSKYPPNDRRVSFATLAIHISGFLILFVLPRTLLGLRIEWTKRLRDYNHLMQTFFLLPQILANFMWQNHVEPVRKVYYLGFTLLGLLTSNYERFRDPFNLEGNRPSSNVASAFGGAAFSVIIIVMAAVVRVRRCVNFYWKK